MSQPLISQVWIFRNSGIPIVSRAYGPKLDIDETWAIIQSLGVGFTVKKEESLFLLAAKNEQLTSNRRMRFLRALDRLQFHVVYKSMYGEEFIRKTAFHKRS